MFILKKILNSNTTYPDTTRMVCGAEEYRYGDFLKISGSGVVYNIEDGEKPTHVCCENAKKGEKSSILCFPITEDMIFSAPALSVMTDTHPGAKLILIKNGSDFVNSVTEDSVEGNVYVYDTCGATKSGDRILIRFAQ